MGIATTSGVIRDFAGPYFVSEDNMAFGWPTKYWPMDPYRAQGGPTAWDRGISLASEEYQGRMVSCCHWSSEIVMKVFHRMIMVYLLFQLSSEVIFKSSTERSQ